MVINRNSLQAAGAGQNSRVLPDDAVVSYCDTLGERLGWLAKALTEEQRAGRLSIAACQAAQAFMQEIRATVLVMALKHGRQLLEVEPVPMTIDPTESGMPTFKDFWMLRDDRDHAEEQLKQIPQRPELIEQALDAIYNGHRPVKQQILWLQRAYMERLAATPVVSDFRQGEPVKLSAEANGRLYAISWTGVIRSLSLFESVTLSFEERGGWHVTGGIGELRDLIDDLAGGRNTLPEMIGLLNQAPWIVPRAIERVTLGPYQFVAQPAEEKLRIELRACTVDSEAQWAKMASRAIIKVAAAPTSVALPDCEDVATRGTRARARSIVRASVDGGTVFALDRLSSAELTSGIVAPRAVTIRLRHE